MFQQLKNFHAKTGHCLVPQNYSENPKLGRWVDTQRQHCKRCSEGKTSSMSTKHIIALESLGFTWSINKHGEWNDSYKELKLYHAEFGNCMVPTTYPLNPKLGRWVNNQRQQYKRWRGGKSSAMSDERYSSLKELGFTWSIHKMDAWGDMLEQLKQYKVKYENTNVPGNFPLNPKLGRWVNNQRQFYKSYKEGKRSSMSPERVSVLESIGFQWCIAGPRSKK
eukprot:CAMPEP_0171303802 /NCGR_PEP_ID=MMETSP0816-20121228/13402_1 /TAXON_ID=420281 /ORGANISM="Proboscia inermis, Strain CCAP1064/1" /LENGTH=221 /DNA_ID=CAMNT_0011783357 /DNA_START=141 /DNA_END=806 /DNA_ORIENTATION=+